MGQNGRVLSSAMKGIDGLACFRFVVWFALVCFPQYCSHALIDNHFLYLGFLFPFLTHHYSCASYLVNNDFSFFSAKLFCLFYNYFNFFSISYYYNHLYWTCSYFSTWNPLLWLWIPVFVIVVFVPSSEYS